MKIRVSILSIVLSAATVCHADTLFETSIEFAQQPDILVLHMPVPEKITSTGRKVHAPQGIIGKIASSAGADRLVLSYFMARSLRDMNENLNIIQSRFEGKIFTADDLDCFTL